MSVINSTPLIAAGDDGYNISRSVRLRSSASAYFNRTYGTPTDAKKWTLSFWLKRGLIGSASYQIMSAGSAISDQFHISADALSLYLGGAYRLVTTQVLRDPSAWYHIVLVVDTANATADNRNIMYINGVQVTSFSTRSNLSLNATTNLNAASTVTYIGRYAASSAEYTDGYLTEVNFIDGQALTPSSFGETDAVTGVWKPKKYAGTYGTNGFYLNFSDNSNNTAATIGKDSSGNGNNWTPNNISVTSGVTYDSMLDVPTLWADGGNGRGNYAVLSPTVALSGRTTLSAANLQTLGTSSSESGIEYGTIQASSGKWYWECTVLALSTSASYPAFGVGRTLVNNSNGDAPAFESGGAAIFTGGAVYKESSLVTTVSSYTTNDVIGIALDVNNLTCAFYKNGTLLTTVTSLTAGTYFATIGSYYNSSAAINFGQRPFAYTPPTGFKALNTQNLPDATIKKGSAYFDVSLWTGDATTPRAVVSNLAFSPDLVWTKDRSVGYQHSLQDTVRGTGASKKLYSSLTEAENGANAVYGHINSFDANGFTVATGSSGAQHVNASGVTYVGWQWKESVTAGFDIVTYTGTGANRTVAHSLGVAPSMMVVKRRSTSGSYWMVYHSSLSSPASKYLSLNTADAATTDTTVWNATAPTSSVISLGTIAATNQNAETYVAYLFAEVAGFSRFGSYTGNGSADGPFVYTGFRPKFVLIKSSSAVQSWHLIDTARDTYNLAGQGLDANTSAAEYTPASSGYPIDILSNGFKHRYASEPNVSGATYIYAAFAENPFKHSLGR